MPYLEHMSRFATNEQLLTASQLGKRWGLHRASVLRMFRAGAIPGIILARAPENHRGAGKSTVRFRLAAIRAFERARERTAVGTARAYRRHDASTAESARRGEAQP